MSRRSARNASPCSVNTGAPSNCTLPPVARSRRSNRRPVVDLPHPDSPTSPSVSARSMWKLTPSTARTYPTTCRNTPAVTGKCITRSRTRTNGAAPPPRSAPTPCAAAAVPPGVVRTAAATPDGAVPSTGAGSSRAARAAAGSAATVAGSCSRQRASRPAPAASSGGVPRRHGSPANSQRGANAQPGGSRNGSGTVPVIGVRRAPRCCSMFGMEPSSARV